MDARAIEVVDVIGGHFFLSDGVGWGDQEPRPWMVRWTMPISRTGAINSSMGSASGDQGEYLAGSLMASLLGQLDCEQLKITNLLGGHGGVG